jgi:hypothetical protein
MKRLLVICFLMAALIMLISPSLASAHYTQKVCTFMGTVKVDGRPVPDGTEIIPWVPGVAPEIYERWKTETHTSNGMSVYICRVPDDDQDTAEKDGASPTDEVRFYIQLGVAKLTADQSVNFGHALNSPNRLHVINLTASYMAAPQLISPLDGAKVLAIEVSFDWSDVVAEGVTYSLQVDKEADFSSPAIDVSGLSDSQYTIAFPLDEGAGTYYWRAKAVDAGVWSSDWSSVWAFTAPNIGYQTLVAGWNLVTYKGETMPTETALASVVDHVVVVWGRDNESGAWHGYAPGGGFANDLPELVQYEPYWIYVNQRIVMNYSMDC